MADQKLTQLTALASLSSDDLFYVVDDPAGAALSRKMAASVLDARYLQDAPSDGSTYGRNNAAWVVVGAASTLPVADTQTIVKGSADATKLLRFEIDGFTAGATRVMTPPNQDTLLAGQNVANVFTVDQTYTANLIYAEPAGASHKFYAVDPVDPDAKLFNWNIATSDNAGSLRDNVVMNWGYNVAAGGGPEDDTDGCFYQQLETFYQPGGTSQFEYHWDFFLSGGADPGVRPMHLNCVHDTGLIDLHWFTDGINWTSAHDGQFDLMVMTVGATEVASRLNIYVPTIHEQLLSFAGTTHAGLKLNSLTTAQRNALSASNGMLIYNTTDGQVQGYVAGAWGQIGGGGGGTPGGADTQVQFNDGGAFGGDANFTWEKIERYLAIESDAPYALYIAQTGVLDSLFVVDAFSGRVGINTNPGAVLHVHGNPNEDNLILFSRSDDSDLMTLTYSTDGPIWLADAAANLMEFRTGSDAGKGMKFRIMNSTGYMRYSNLDDYTLMQLDADRDVSIGHGVNPGGRLHIKVDDTEARPVLYLQQADVDMPMMQFDTTIGTGNAVEAVGAKTLTTTHFIMVTLPGGLTRYFPVGTIA